ncbi:MAG: MGMT family protein [Hadesarchaea archaeon]|nr:MGMT family protein [Hadesarchaea archaeon]
MPTVTVLRDDRGLVAAAVIRGKTLLATSIGCDEEKTMADAIKRSGGGAHLALDDFGLKVCSELLKAARGKPMKFGYRLNFTRMSPLARKILRLVQRIPRGEVVDYAGLARRAGTHPRAVGRILSLNPYPLIVPCHRVVMANGRLGGYSLGAQLKARILEAEGIKIDGKLQRIKRNGPQRRG